MASNLDQAFPREAVRIGVSATDWRDAVRAAGDLLVEIGAAEDAYVEAIVDAVEDMGPYIVLAPGIAIAHARPEDGAVAVGFSLARLSEPVEFGAGNNDPVDLVFAFASPDKEDHISALSTLANLLEEQGNLKRMREATTVAELHDVIQEAEA